MPQQHNGKSPAFLPRVEQSISSPAEVFTDRISIEQMRRIWNDKKVQYTDDELLRIREWLYTMAGVVVQVVEKNAGDEAIIMTSRKKRSKRKQPPIIFVETAKKAA